MDKITQLFQDYTSCKISLDVLQYKIECMGEKQDKYNPLINRIIKTQHNIMPKELYGSHALSPEDILCEQERVVELLEFVKKALAILPPKQRIVFHLIVLLGYKNKEVSELLQVSHSTVSDYLRYACEKLKGKLDDMRELLLPEESTLEASTPVLSVNFLTDHYRKLYEGKINRQGNYITNCRVNIPLDNAFGDKKTVCCYCERCTNKIMKERNYE